jgi:hypothetical protein
MTYQSTDLPTISDEYGTSDFEGQLVYDKVAYYVKGSSTLELDFEDKDERGNVVSYEDKDIEIWFESIMKGECGDEEINDTDGEIEAALSSMLQIQNYI